MKDKEHIGTGVVGQLFGIPQPTKDPDLVIIPVPWDATVSYREGTSQAPAGILEASSQLDLGIYMVKKPWKFRMGMGPISKELSESSKKHRKEGRMVIDALEKGAKPDQNAISKVNYACERMIDQIQAEAVQVLDQGKICAVLGGDHSSSLGLIKALGERHQFGILQIDAHMDLRDAYQGFTYSHASLMHNALKVDGVTSLVQVGIRDYSSDEERYASNSDKPVQVFFDDHIKSGLMIGDSWSDWVHSIIAMLPEKVYISFDIDGLEPSLCPSTGTPVPGGLSFDQANYLLMKLAQSGRKVVGFDLCEVGSEQYDAVVGARILYRLGVYTGVSQGKIKTSM